MKDYIDLTKRPHLKIWCGARGVGGKVYGCRPYGTTTQMEYLYFDEKEEKMKWLNDNGYCSIKPL